MGIIVYGKQTSVRDDDVAGLKFEITIILLAVDICSYAYIRTANNVSIMKCAQYSPKIFGDYISA
jgi:hypothetical protein